MWSTRAYYLENIILFNSKSDHRFNIDRLRKGDEVNNGLPRANTRSVCNRVGSLASGDTSDFEACSVRAFDTSAVETCSMRAFAMQVAGGRPAAVAAADQCL